MNHYKQEEEKPKTVKTKDKKTERSKGAEIKVTVQISNLVNDRWDLEVWADVQVSGVCSLAASGGPNSTRALFSSLSWNPFR